MCEELRGLSSGANAPCDQAATRRRAELEALRAEAEAHRQAYLASVAAGAPATLVADRRLAWNEARTRVSRLEFVVLSYEGVAAFRRQVAAGASPRSLTAGPARRRKRRPDGRRAVGGAGAGDGAGSGATRP